MLVHGSIFLGALKHLAAPSLKDLAESRFQRIIMLCDASEVSLGSAESKSCVADNDLDCISIDVLVVWKTASH